MRPSVIDSVCAARPLFFLGDAITELNAYTTGSAHTCGPARLRAADLYGTLLFPGPEGGTSRSEIMTVRVWERVKIESVDPGSETSRISQVVSSSVVVLI